jgi:cytochrome b pre-mRNA-processing protein 3
MLNVFRRNPRATTIEALYGAIVAQARSPVFYLGYGIPDTVNGRLDVLMLHLAMAFERLSQGNDQAKAAGQETFDRFCLDMDDHLREEGFSDIKVPKEVRGVAAAFFGRHGAYISALRAGDAAALQTAISRNVFEGAPAPSVPRLAAYMQAAMAMLDGQDPSLIATGRIAWPDPDTISA